MIANYGVMDEEFISQRNAVCLRWKTDYYLEVCASYLRNPEAKHFFKSLGEVCSRLALPTSFFLSNSCDLRALNPRPAVSRGAERVKGGVRGHVNIPYL